MMKLLLSLYMSLASKVGPVIGTAIDYAVQYVGKASIPLSVISMMYTNRKKIQKFAVKHSFNKNSYDTVQNNCTNISSVIFINNKTNIDCYY